MVLGLIPDKNGRPGPAQRAGVLPGQKIKRVNGVDVVDKPGVVAALRYSKEAIEFWVEPRQWAVAVPSTEIIGDQYTTYTVVAAVNGIKPNESSVIRRYSDFNNLQRALPAISSDVVIPPFPPKKWWGHLAPEFVEDRRKVLTACEPCHA